MTFLFYPGQIHAGYLPFTLFFIVLPGKRRMVFRMLTEDELVPLEKDFVLFLASEGIDAQTWQRIKSEEPNKLELLVSSFSDGVWRKIFSHQKYMRHETEEFIFLFDFQENSREVIRISKQTPNEIGHQVTPYRTERAREMFEAAEAGACFSNGEDFKQACLLWASGQKP